MPTLANFESFHALIGARPYDNVIGTRMLEDWVGPSLIIVGFVHGVVALANKRFTRRSVVVVTLALLGAMTMRHAYLVEDAFHMLNAQTPALVMLVALMAGTNRARLATLALPAFWLAAGSAIPFHAPLAPIAARPEPPSFGAPYPFHDPPRRGGEHIG